MGSFDRRNCPASSRAENLDTRTDVTMTGADGDVLANRDVPREEEQAAERYLPPGTMIQHYELIRELGRGGMGVVYLARDTRLGRLVAVKLLSQPRSRLGERFRVEARATARCRHENIVVIHEVGEDEERGTPFMVLEYLEGQTLKEWMSARARTDADEVGEAAPGIGMSPARVAELMVPVVRALVCAHELGIVHRDLKPGNILLTSVGTIKVLDFSIAKLLSTPEGASDRAIDMSSLCDLTQQGMRVGTVPYMPPEQLAGEHIDHRADLWAVGIMLYELAAGAHPLAPLTRAKLGQIADLDVPMPSAADVQPELGPLASIIDRCLIKQRDDRMSSASELLAELEALLPGGHRRITDDDSCPYAGLGAFQERDVDRFFGRAGDVAAVVTRLGEQPMVAVVGPSGAGKSSFVRAGVIPALKRSGEPWEAMIVRPGRRPLIALAALLVHRYSTSRAPSAELVAPSADLEEVAARLLHEPGFLGTALRARARRRLRRILVFIDQLEELYTLGAAAAERAAFAACLEGAADLPDAPLRVVVTIRADFLERAAEDERFIGELTRGLWFLRPMAGENVRDALLKPLGEAGYRIESPELEAEILAGLAASRSALPLLQFTATRLWELRDRSRRLITWAGYRTIGGIAGALASHADAVITGMSAAHRKLARAVLERMVTPERTRAVVGMAELRCLGDSPQEIDAVLDVLVDARLLTVEMSDDAQTQVVEIVHESLIAGWPMLSRWLDEHHDDAAFMGRLRSAAAAWRHSGRAAGLLWRDETIDEAQRWRQRYVGELTATEEAFLSAGFALAEHSQRRRRRVIGATVVLSLVVAASMAQLAWKQAQASDKATLEASRAREQADKTLDVARVLVARENIATDPTSAWALLREVRHPAEVRSWRLDIGGLLYAPLARAVLQGHEHLIGHGSFSPDGRRVLTASLDGTARVWAVDGTSEPVVLRGHEGGLRMAVFTPDGARVVTASLDGTARIWNADGSGEPIILAGHQGPVFTVSVSPGGTHVLTASGDTTARIWSLRGGEPEQILRGHEDAVESAFYSPDGARVVTTSRDSTARIWSADGSGEPIVLRGHTQPVHRASFSPDGARVVTSSRDATARIWNVDGSGEPVVLRGHSRAVRGASFSPDGAHVATASMDGTARVWAADGSGAPVVITHTASVLPGHLAFSPNGSYLAVGWQNGESWILDTQGKKQPLQLKRNGGSIWWVAFSPDSRLLLSVSHDGTARVWSIDDARQPVVLSGGSSIIWGADLSEDGRRVVAFSDDDTVLIWDMDATIHEPVRRLSVSHRLTCGSLSPTGAYVAVGTEQGSVQVWATDGSGRSLVRSGHTGSVRTVSFSPDSTRIATASQDGTARIRNVDGSGPDVVLRGHEDGSRVVAWSPDGALVATGSYDTTARIWNADGSGTPVVLRGHTSAVHSLVFSPDGAYLVTISWDGTARVWPVSGGEPMVLPHSSGPSITQLFAVAFSPDGRQIVTGGNDGTVWVWNVDGSGEPLRLEGHTANVSGSIGFSPDGSLILSSAEDGTARIWNADGTGVPVVLRGHVGAVYSSEFSHDGKHVITAGGDGTVRIWQTVRPILDLEPVLWKATTFCMSVARRIELLGVDQATAERELARCRERVQSALGNEPSYYRFRFRCPVSDIRFPASDIRFPISGFRLPVPGFRPRIDQLVISGISTMKAVPRPDVLSQRMVPRSR